MDDHKCPAKGCTIHVEFGTLACRTHWFMLPPDLRRDISKAWRTGNLIRHGELRKQAVAFWRGHVAPVGPKPIGGPGPMIVGEDGPEEITVRKPTE